MWKSEQDKLEKSGWKWVESDFLPYRYSELFCEKSPPQWERGLKLTYNDLLDIGEKG